MDSINLSDPVDFVDITSLLEEGAADMHEEQLLFMDGFSLQDAMNAVEIGEPRLDSRFIVPGEASPPRFNPLTPLLPEELCWVIDRSFAYEMEWHAGNHMSHSVMTFLYIHHLSSTDPDLISPDALTLSDQSRPLELIAVVLRAITCGLLKCCDLAWRELSKGSVEDAEDWHSDKCETSLLEGKPTGHIVSMLEQASVWVSDSPKVPPQWKDPIIFRLQLRKTILQLLEISVHRSAADFQSFITICRELSARIQAEPLTEPANNSPARHAFDPRVSRRLNTSIPPRVLPIRPMEEIWQLFGQLLDGLEEMNRLVSVHNIMTWNFVGNMRSWFSKPTILQPYARSLTQSVFYDDFLLLDKYPFYWVVERFFVETVGTTWQGFKVEINRRWFGPSPPPYDVMERQLFEVLIPQIRLNWSNPPRRRRQLMKLLPRWHIIYDLFTNILVDVDVSDLPNEHILKRLPQTALLWRLGAICDVALSGFQLELYNCEEKVFNYWYLSQVLAAQFECCRTLIPAVDESTRAHGELVWIQQYAYSMRLLTESLFKLFVQFLKNTYLFSEKYDSEQREAVHFRRFKWAIGPAYENADSHPIAQPDFSMFRRVCGRHLRGHELLDGFKFAHESFQAMLEAGNVGGWAEPWQHERTMLIQKLVEICEQFLMFAEVAPSSINDYDIIWNPSFHPWFPLIRKRDQV